MKWRKATKAKAKGDCKNRRRRRRRRTSLPADHSTFPPSSLCLRNCKSLKLSLFHSHSLSFPSFFFFFPFHPLIYRLSSFFHRIHTSNCLLIHHFPESFVLFESICWNPSGFGFFYPEIVKCLLGMFRIMWWFWRVPSLFCIA